MSAHYEHSFNMGMKELSNLTTEPSSNSSNCSCGSQRPLSKGRSNLFHLFYGRCENEEFCQQGQVPDHGMCPTMNDKLVSNSIKQKNRHASILKPSLMERFFYQYPPEKEIGNSADSSGAARAKERKSRCESAKRMSLEEEVAMLQKQLEREVSLHLTLERALGHAAGALPQFPRHLPTRTQELLADIATLEVAVMRLEQQATSLQCQLEHERRERQSVEQKLSLSSSSFQTTFTANSIAERVTTGSPRVLSLHRGGSSVKTLAEHLGCGMPIHRKNDQNLDECTRAAVVSHRYSPVSAASEKSQQKSVNSQSLFEKSVRFSPRVTSYPSPRSLDSAIRERCQLPSFAALDESTTSVLSGEREVFLFSGSPAGGQLSLSSSSSGKSIQMSPALEESLCTSPVTHEMNLFWTASGEHAFTQVSEKGGTSASSVASGELALLTSPPTPEHCLRPTSPVNYEGYSLPYNAPSERHLKEMSRFLPTPKRRTIWSFSSDEEFPTISKEPDQRWPPAEAGQTLSPMNYPKSYLAGGYDSSQLSALAKAPNNLSEEMVRCMVKIYHHLADPAVSNSQCSTFDSFPSPTSPFGNITSSSRSSFSESSLLSFVRSPLIDLRSKEDIIGTENSPDPYKIQGKLPWADIGAYASMSEVPWMTVNKEQLQYAAQALLKFRLLVELLAGVDPECMSHEEKLAFWINLYNALIMHAYLAYGIPKSDLKYFSLSQKAAYNVGGHLFNIAAIEYSLLRAKTPAHRPQIGLLMALHKTKLSDDSWSFAIDHPEPLVAFALCSGSRSSPCVRIYTPDNVRESLEIGLRDYARAAVGISSKGKLLVPKLMYTFAQDFVEQQDLVDWICQLLPTSQASVIQECWQQRKQRLLGARKFSVLPFDFRFRYLFAMGTDEASAT